MEKLSFVAMVMSAPLSLNCGPGRGKRIEWVKKNLYCIDGCPRHGIATDTDWAEWLEECLHLTAWARACREMDRYDAAYAEAREAVRVAFAGWLVCEYLRPHSYQVAPYGGYAVMQ